MTIKEEPRLENTSFHGTFSLTPFLHNFTPSHLVFLRKYTEIVSASPL